ncbi:MAG: LLM class flavin-dependent oxidoreductase [Nocardioidaceae bacterium]
MRLGVNVGYVAGPDVAERVETAVYAETLGYEVVWAAEAYGSDAPTMLSWIGSKTSTIGLGSAIMQIPARTPAMTAMTAATLDSLSGGRFRLGLGVSGPQVSEGWHGVRFDKPLGRTREYVDIVRTALRRETVAYDGEHFTLPLPDGPGKALKIMLHPYRPDIPVYLASVGPKNLELTGEIADGWLAIFFAPEHAAVSTDPIRAGLERAGRDAASFDIVPTVPVIVGDDLQECAAPLRAYTALVRRRDGQPQAELLQRTRQADGVRGRGGGDPGPLPRQAPARCGGGRTVRARRPDGADRSQGADRRTPARVRRGRSHDAERRLVRRDP